MDTGQMLELFTADKGTGGGGGGVHRRERRRAPPPQTPSPADSKRLAGLDELWDESQYKEEFALMGSSRAREQVIGDEISIDVVS